MITPFLLGGYVKIVGFQGTPDQIREYIKEIEPDEESERYKMLANEASWYGNKSRRLRFRVMMGGILFNYLTFILIPPVVHLFLPSRGECTEIISETIHDSGDIITGFKPGDIILRIDSHPLPTPREIQEIAQSASPGQLHAVTTAREESSLRYCVRAMTGSALTTMAVRTVSATPKANRLAYEVLAEHTSAAPYITQKLNRNPDSSRDLGGATPIGLLYDGVTAASRGQMVFLLWLGALSLVFVKANIIPISFLDGGKMLSILTGEEDTMLAGSVSEQPTPPLRLPIANRIVNSFKALALCALLAWLVWFDCHRFYVTFLTY